MSAQVDNQLNRASETSGNINEQNRNNKETSYGCNISKDDTTNTICQNGDGTKSSQMLGQQQKESETIESYETDYDRIKQTLNCIKMLYQGSDGTEINKRLKRNTVAKLKRISNKKKILMGSVEEKEINSTNTGGNVLKEESIVQTEQAIHQKKGSKPTSPELKTVAESGSELMDSDIQCNVEMSDVSPTKFEFQVINENKQSHSISQENVANLVNNTASHDNHPTLLENSTLGTKSETLPVEVFDAGSEGKPHHKIWHKKPYANLSITAENSSEIVRDATNVQNSVQSNVASEISAERSEHEETKSNKYNISRLYMERRTTSDTFSKMLTDVKNNQNNGFDLNSDDSNRKSRSKRTRDRYQMRCANVERYIASMLSEENVPEREGDDILLNRQNSPEAIGDCGKPEEESEDTFGNKSVLDSQNDLENETTYLKNIEEKFFERKIGKQKVIKNHNTRSVGSAETMQTTKKRTKGNKAEKKRNSSGNNYTLPVKQKGKITEDILSITAKPKKKKISKLRLTSSRNTIGHQPECGGDRDRFSPGETYSTTQVPYQVWPTDNIVELYHNAATRPDVTTSDMSISHKAPIDERRIPPQKFIKTRNQKFINMTQRMNKLREHIDEEEMYDQGKTKGHLLDTRDNKYDVKDKILQNEHEEGRLTSHDFSEGAGEMMTVEVIKQKIAAPQSTKKGLKSSITNNIQRKKPQATFNMQSYNVSSTVTEDPGFTSNQKRNFELPTLSSQSKHVCQSSFHKFNFHTIPFVVGTSTTPSHNLGLNIQQTLSIMKLHHPTTGQSPMKLASAILHEKQHTLAGEHLQPVPSFQSRLNTCTDWQSSCPALASISDMTEIPTKEDTQAVSKDIVPSEAKHSETEVKSDNPWSMDDKPVNSQAHCTCYPSHPRTNFQTLLSSYLDGGSKSVISSKPRLSFSGIRSQNFLFRHQQHLPTIPQISGNVNGVGQMFDAKDIDDVPTKESSTVSAAGTVKEDRVDIKTHDYTKQLTEQKKGLKDILLKLHSDFVRLNNKYEELRIKSKNDQGKNAEIFKELQAVEAELDAKEDEITVLMQLYEEVILLKRQTKALMQRVSNPSLSNVAKDGRRVAPRETSVAFLLTRLLRSIQRIQEKLRQE